VAENRAHSHNVHVKPFQLAEKRNLIGLVALVCLATAAGLWVFSANPVQNQFLAAVSRVGIVLAALWLALPARGEKLALGRAGPILVVAAIFVALSGRRLLYLLPAAIVVGLALAFLRPRSRRRKSR
jgi:hypothetical protein